MGLALKGCGDDLLDKQPLDRISSEEFWETETDFHMGLTSLYGSLQGGGGLFSYGIPNWDVITDNAYGQHNYWGSQEFVQGTISPSSGGYITDVYNASYNGIARINIFLQQLEAEQGSVLDPETKSRMEAEARFIRGYYYWMLFFTYGDVPIVTQPLSLDNQVQPKSSAQEVLDQSLSDLDFAIANLPDVLYASGGGRAVKSSAQALKTRILMYTAFDRNGDPDDMVLNQARELALEVMGDGYQLDAEFANVFRDGTQEGNPEIIFSIKFLAPDNSHSMDLWYGDWLVVGPLQNFVDEFEQGDIRLDETIFEEVVEFNGNIHNPSDHDPTGYGLKKFLSPNEIPYTYSTNSQQDWVMLRYAEVLLMYAEAQNELSGPDASVYEAINEIRNRAGLAPLSEGLNQMQMRESIRHERRVELAFEGLRLYDLKRWGIAQEVLNNVQDGILTYNYEERFYHWPLPQTEIDKSQGELVQNPDY